MAATAYSPRRGMTRARSGMCRCVHQEVRPRERLLNLGGKQGWYHKGHARLTSQHTEPGEQGCQFTPIPVPLTGSPGSSDLAFAPRRAAALSGDVLVASVLPELRVYAIHRYGSVQSGERGVAA